MKGPRSVIPGVAVATIGKRRVSAVVMYRIHSGLCPGDSLNSFNHNWLCRRALNESD
jgi:hypothetical protein